MAPVRLAGSAAADPAYWCFQLLGAGTLFPWNVLITAADWWEARFPGKHTDRLLTVCYLPVNLVVIAAMVHWHARVRPRLRVAGGLLGFTLALAAVTLLNLTPPSPGTLAAVLLLVALCGVCDGLAQGALFGEVALLPPRYTQALVAGTAVSGVAVSLLRVATKATLPDTPAGLRRSADLYFVIAALVCGTCTLMYCAVLPRLSGLQQHRRAALEAALRDDAGSGGGGGEARWQAAAPGIGEAERLRGWGGAEGSPPAVELSSEDPRRLPGKGLGADALSEQAEQAERALLVGNGWTNQTNGSAAQLPLPSCAAGPRREGSTWAALPLVAPLAASLVLIYGVTLSIFPGVLAEDVHSAELGSWYPVALIAAFNVADWAGKSLPGAAAARLSNPGGMLGAAAARALFIPAFHLAATGGVGPAAIGPLTALLGASNGYLTACAMVAAPSRVPPAAAEAVGNLMVLFLILGLCIGAACGFLWLL